MSPERDGEQAPMSPVQDGERAPVSPAQDGERALVSPVQGGGRGPARGGRGGQTVLGGGRRDPAGGGRGSPTGSGGGGRGPAGSGGGGQALAGSGGGGPAGGGGRAPTSMTVTQSDSCGVTSLQQNISDENEHSSSSPSTSENESAPEPSTSSSSSSTGSSYSFGSSFEEDIRAIFGPETSEMPTTFSLKTFKLVGDNVNKNVTPSDVRVDSQTQSLHYFQTYAVRDRIDLTAYDDTPPVVDESKIDTARLLPSDSDHDELTKNFSILVARVLKQYMPFFEKFGFGLERHIRHNHYEEMGQKSEIVS